MMRLIAVNLRIFCKSSFFLILLSFNLLVNLCFVITNDLSLKNENEIYDQIFVAEGNRINAKIQTLKLQREEQNAPSEEEILLNELSQLYVEARNARIFFKDESHWMQAQIQLNEYKLKSAKRLNLTWQESRYELEREIIKMNWLLDQNKTYQSPYQMNSLEYFIKLHESKYFSFQLLGVLVFSCFSVFGRLDKALKTLLIQPYSRTRWLTCCLAALFITSFLLVFAPVLFVGIIQFFRKGIGIFDFPYVIYSAGKYQILPELQIAFYYFIFDLLFLIFLVLTGFFATYFTRDGIKSLLLIALIFSFFSIIQSADKIKNVLQYFPSTYFFMNSVLNGETSQMLQNLNITYKNGVLLYGQINIFLLFSLLFHFKKRNLYD